MLEILGITADKLRNYELIEPQGIMNIAQSILERVDPRMVEHGNRVAYIAVAMAEQLGRYSANQLRELFQLALFHDIGIYKQEEAERLFSSYQRREGMEHSLFGYLFLRHLSPLGDAAEAVLHHHSPTVKINALLPEVRTNAGIIRLSDRIDIMMLSGKQRIETVCREGGLDDEELLPLLREADRWHGIFEKLRSGSYRDSVKRMTLSLCANVEVALNFLSMMVFVIDFKSPVTVDHTVNAMAYAVQLSRLMGQPEREQYCLYLGALLHDVGKVAIPHEILESPGKLSPEQMEIMKTHVVITNEILEGNVCEEVRKIAVRHHEKPDGSGYPLGLDDTMMTETEKVMAVADVMSALLGRRSYKQSFDLERTAGIISDMADNRKLDADICRVALDNLERMVAVSAMSCATVLDAYHNVISDYELLRNRLKSRFIPTKVLEHGWSTE